MSAIIVSKKVQATRSAVWNAISDFEHCSERITGITHSKVIHKPTNGLVGLVWQETRVMYGKEATEEMTVVEAEVGNYYVAEARNHGALYRSKLSLSETDGGVEISLSFDAIPQTFFAKVMNVLFARAMKKSIVRLLEEDLNDIKRSVEQLQTGV